jgi:hypothetical protein
VLLLSRACDDGLAGVQDLLAMAGIASVRVDADRLADAGLVIDADARAVRLYGRWLSPTVSWTRHFSCDAIEGSGDPGQDLFLRESWHAAAAGLAAVSSVQVAPPPHGLLAQLRIARQHGVAVPRTLVTTDPAVARDALRSRRLVVKSAYRHFTEATPGLLTGRFPAVVERLDLTAGPPAGPPVIVQEYLEHDAELRVYYLNGRLLVFEIDKQTPADPWTAPERVGVRRVAPPAAVATAARLLAAAMSLRYGAFDFLIRDGGPVFLEVNPDGDWRWAERRAGTNAVTLGVARLLADLHRDAVPGARPAPPVDLLAFLAAAPVAEYESTPS